MAFSIVIPAYNLQKHIYNTVSSLKKIEDVKEILVIDDGSTDNTPLEAKRAGAKVIRHAKNMGKGQAIKTGLKEVSCSMAVFLDGDLGNLKELTRLMNPVKNGELDMAIALLPRQKKRGLGTVKKTASFLLAKTTGLNLNEPLSGQRALSPQALVELKKNISFLPSDFGIEIGLTLLTAKKGLKIGEIPVPFLHLDSTGLDLKGFRHRGLQGWEIIKAFLNYYLQIEKEKLN